MPRTVFSNSQVAHVWASQSQTYGRNVGDSFYFDAETIYSYRDTYPIARFYEDAKGKRFVILNTKRHSVTTSRHVRLVENALHGLDVTVLRSDNALYALECVTAELGAQRLIDCYVFDWIEATREVTKGLKVKRHARTGLADAVSFGYREIKDDTGRTAWVQDLHASPLTDQVEALAQMVRLICPSHELAKARNPLAWCEKALKAAHAKTDVEIKAKAKRTAENIKRVKKLARETLKTELNPHKGVISAVTSLYLAHDRELKKIQDGRITIHGVQNYNTVRGYFGLSEVGYHVVTNRLRKTIDAFKTLEKNKKFDKDFVSNLNHHLSVVRGKQNEFSSLMYRADSMFDLVKRWSNFECLDSTQKKRECAFSDNLPYATFHDHEFMCHVWPQLSDESRAVLIERVSQIVAMREIQANHDTDEVKTVLQNRQSARYRTKNSYASNASEWMDGKGQMSFQDRTGNTYVRRKGNTLQTSRGAESPWRDAVHIFKLAQDCRLKDRGFVPKESIRAGSFDLRHIRADGSIQVGCHFIAWAEMEALANRETPELLKPKYPVPVVI